MLERIDQCISRIRGRSLVQRLCEPNERTMVSALAAFLVVVLSLRRPLATAERLEQSAPTRDTNISSRCSTGCDCTRAKRVRQGNVRMRRASRVRCLRLSPIPPHMQGCNCCAINRRAVAAFRSFCRISPSTRDCVDRRIWSRAITSR